MIRVFLVDDQPTTRAVLRLRLELETDLVVVGESGNHDTVTQVRSLAPDVVILDAVTALIDVGSTSTLLRELALDWVVVVLTLHDDPATRRRALAAGATYVVGKHDGDELLLAAIRAAAGSRRPPSSAH